MKTTKHMAYALLAVLAAACSKDDFGIATAPPTEGADGRVEMTFTATMAPDTRTVLGEKGEDGKYPVLWNDGDEIAVIPMTSDYIESDVSDIGEMKFTTSIAEGTAATATFKGSTYPGEFGYFAFYPHCNMLGLKGWGNTPDLLDMSFSIPTEQPAMAGTFAPNLCPAYAITKQDGGDLHFQPLCGLVKFSLSGDVVKDLASVRLDAMDGHMIMTGEKCQYGQSFKSYVNYFGETFYQSCVTLNGSFEAEKDYYMVVIPCDLSSGFSFTFTLKDGSVYVREGKIDGFSIDMGQIGNLGKIDLQKADFKPLPEGSITDLQFIRIIEKCLPGGIALTKDAEGYVPLTEDNLKVMASVTELNITSVCLADASALKYFTGLQKLNCCYNSLKSLDVSGLTNLTELDCSGNPLTSLNVGGLTNLTKLDCSQNQLTSLDVSGLTGLAELNCSDNQLTSLNAGGLTNLTELVCSYNQLQSLDVGGLNNLAYLDCGYNQLQSLDVGGLNNLAHLDCRYNELQSLDVNGLKNLTFLDCRYNRLLTLAVNEVTTLTVLYCHMNRLTQLDVKALTGLTNLDCSDNDLTEVDVSDNVLLTRLGCSSNRLTKLDVSRLTNMEFLYCYGNRIQTLDISNMTGLVTVYCGKQTTDGTTPQTLALTLTAAQRDGAWTNSLVYDSEYNEPVALNVLE